MEQRILIVGPTPPPYYGVANATKTIVESSLRDDFDLLHLDTSDRRNALNFGRLDIINVWLGIKHLIQLVRLLLWKRPHIVYIPISQGPLAYVRDAMFIFLGALCGTKIVLHLRGGYFRSFYESSNVWLRCLIRASLSKADRMIVLGESLRPLFSGLIPPDRIRVVPNGVDPEDFPQADLRSRQNAPVRIGYLGNMYRTKGFLDLLSAVAMLKDKYKLECVLAGEWREEDEKQEALAFLQRNRMEGVVRFVGVVKGESKKQFLQSCDMFVFPTYYKPEGHPWVILEAMAAGLPVISTDHACIPETVEDQVTGFIVPKMDVPELARKIELLVKSPEMRAFMGSNSRQRLQTVFSKHLFIQRLRSVFQELGSVSAKVQNQLSEGPAN